MSPDEVIANLRAEQEEMQDWVSLAGLIGACDIHARQATNEQVGDMRDALKQESSVRICIYDHQTPPPFAPYNDTIEKYFDLIMATEAQYDRLGLMSAMLIDLVD